METITAKHVIVGSTVTTDVYIYISERRCCIFFLKEVCEQGYDEMDGWIDG